MTDSEMTRLRLDGGMGYDAAADTNRFAVPRLMTVLHALVGYDGILIIACRDTQPLAHETLARELAARGLFPWIIVRHLAGASEVKHVDPRFQTLILDSYTWHPDVDAWAASADRGFHPPLTSWADLHGSVGAFVDEVLARRSSDAPERTPLGRVVRDQ